MLNKYFGRLTTASLFVALLSFIAQAEDIPIATNAIPDHANWGYQITGLGDSGDEVALVFTNKTATMSWTAPENVASVQLLVVGGGGSGGVTWAGSGGGGAGAMRYESDVAVVAETEYAVKVGAGGAAVTSSNSYGNDGSQSKFGTYTAAGGGGGGQSGIGHNGGSGGGGGATNNGGTALDPNYGHNGGKAATGYGGGGGGAGAAGKGGGSSATGGAGGAGAMCAITGEELYYAGGGGGGTYADTSDHISAGGIGGGGKGGNRKNSINATDGVNGLGGGGGGARANSVRSGKGGDGVVIIRYAVSGGHVHTFGPWEVYTPATVAVKGEKRRYCTDAGCEAFESEAIPMLEPSRDMIPEGYVSIVCLDSGKGQYIDTGIAVQDKLGCKIKFSYLNYTNENSCILGANGFNESGVRGNRVYFGAVHTFEADDYQWRTAVGKSSEFKYLTNLGQARENERYILESAINGTQFTVSITNTHTGATCSQTVTDGPVVQENGGPTTLTLFAFNGASIKQCADAQLFYCEIYTNSTVRARVFYPCYEKATGRYGVFDLVTGQFFGSASGTEFGVPSYELLNSFDLEELGYMGTYTANGYIYQVATFTNTLVECMFKIPDVLPYYDCLLVGAGGAGGGADVEGKHSGAAGGNAGQVFHAELTPIVANSYYYVKPGKGGSAAYPGLRNGGKSYVSHTTAWRKGPWTTIHSANGGTAGAECGDTVGAGGAGGNGSGGNGSAAAGSTGGVGGLGTASTISGSSVIYAVGGNGANGNAGVIQGLDGAFGGGGDGSAADGSTVLGGNGGDGIVIFRYPIGIAPTPSDPDEPLIGGDITITDTGLGLSVTNANDAYQYGYKTSTDLFTLDAAPLTPFQAKDIDKRSTSVYFLTLPRNPAEPKRFYKICVELMK